MSQLFTMMILTKSKALKLGAGYLLIYKTI